jgi:hypothetical protein
MNEPQDDSVVDLQAFALQVRQFVRTHLPVDLRETVRSGRPPDGAAYVESIKRLSSHD